MGEGCGDRAGRSRCDRLGSPAHFAAHGVEFRQHTIVLYNSIYLADDEMLVNTHLYGLPAHMTPLLHFRRIRGAELFAGYVDGFERVWATSAALDTARSVAWTSSSTGGVDTPARRPPSPPRTGPGRCASGVSRCSGRTRCSGTSCLS